TRRHLQARGVVAEIIKLYGSIEIAPLVGLADRVVGLVSSGETLRQHRLRAGETSLGHRARVCAGPGGYGRSPPACAWGARPPSCAATASTISSPGCARSSLPSRRSRSGR